MSMYVVSSLQTITKDLFVHADFTHFFNTPEFLSLKELKSSRFVLKNENVVIAEINFISLDKVAISGYQATFGSFDLYTGITQNSLGFFLTEIEKELKYAGIEQMKIRHWPSAYPSSELVEYGLQSAGFELICTNINQHLTISPQAFPTKIRYSEQKKLAQCHRQQFIFKQENEEALERVYDLVVDARKRKSFPVTMSFEALSKGVKARPENYLIFSVYDGHQLIAAAVSIVINNSIIYNFYHADHEGYRNFSPTVMLLEGIYKFCQKNNYSILDLGISSENGVINQGLFTFKHNMGCTSSPKHIFSKILN